MIDEFKSLISRRGLAMTNRFQVHFPSLPTVSAGILGNSNRDLTLLCESAQIPGKQIMSFEHSLFGPALKIPSAYIQEDVTLSFILTNDYFVKDIFDRWQEAVIDPSSFHLKYDSEFKRDILISQLTDHDKAERNNTHPAYTVKLVNAYPITVTAIALDNNIDDAIQKLQVTFAYDRFEKYQ